ncbi:MAG: ABC transporter permease, partial [Chloroflexota bacterium]
MAMSDTVALEVQRRRRPAVSIVQSVAGFARWKPLGAVGAAILLLVITVAIAAPYVAPSDPLTLRAAHRFEPPGAGFLLGTDKFGRDILSRVIFGARISLWVGIVSVGIGAGLGSVIGVISGYAGGRADLLVQRAMDAILAFPTLIL